MIGRERNGVGGRFWNLFTKYLVTIYVQGYKYWNSWFAMNVLMAVDLAWWPFVSI